MQGEELQSRDPLVTSKGGRVQEKRDEPTSEEPPNANQNEAELLQDEIESLRAKLARHKAEMARKDAEMARKDEEMARKDEEMARKDEEMARKEAEMAKKMAKKDAEMAKKMAKKDAEIEKKDMIGSVKQMLETNEGLPPLRQNTAATSSTEQNSNGKREGGDGEDGEPSKKKRHEKATIKNLEPFNFDKILKGFALNFKEKDREEEGKTNYVKSQLAPSVNEIGYLPNYNEATVVGHICNLLRDVMRCMGLVNAEVAQEMSFFSMVPDIVVLKYMGAIVLEIEVKNEGRDVSKVMANEEVAGQCLDYARALKRTNIDTPIVCLSTYTTMRIGSTEESIQNIANKAVQRLKQVNAFKPFGRRSVTGKPSSSPEKKGNATSVVPWDSSAEEEGNETMNDSGGSPDFVEEEVDKDEREIYFSDMFNESNMFKALTLAVACGCISAEESQTANGGLHYNRIPLEGEKVDGVYNKVQVKSYAWVKVSCVKATYKLDKKVWRKDSIVYMKEVLGMGNTGKVYLCMDSKGYHFALKMLFYDSDAMRSFAPQQREDDKRACMEQLDEVLLEEAKRWRIIYPDYEPAIWKGILNELPCLAMPYVASIPVHRRNDLLGKIEEELKRIVKLGYVYKDEDIRWRHVGLRMNRDREEQIVFVDMESLDKVDEKTPNEERNKKVKEIIQSLRKRSGLDGTNVTQVAQTSA